MTPQVADFFVLRTPLLPFATLTEWADLERPALARDRPAEAYAEAYARDVEVLRARLRTIIARPEVREALFIASPSLDASVTAWLAGGRGDANDAQVERAVARYLARMAGRATPFGLFAGCSLGAMATTTELAIAGATAYRRHTRLDSDYLALLVDAIHRVPEARRAARLRPNSSLYRAASRLRYAEASVVDGERVYHLVAVEPTPYLEATLARAHDGAAFSELAAALVDDEVTHDDAEAFVAELVDSQLLVPELAAPVTGREPIHELVDQLAGAIETRPIADALDTARRAMARLDGEPLGLGSAGYRDVAGGLAALPVAPEPARTFQVDLTKPAPHATLGAEVVGELVRGVELLRRISSPRPSALARFRDAFVERYDGRELPLAEALDDDIGIGFDRGGAPSSIAPLLDGLAFPPSRPPPPPSTPLTTVLLHLLDDARRRGANEITLDDAAIADLAPAKMPALASSFAVVATIAAASPQEGYDRQAGAVNAVATGAFRIWLQTVSGPSGVNLLGRFCHADPALAAHVARHVAAEEAARPDAIFAEVVHQPQGRVGNVLLRPLLRRHDIVYLGRSGAPRDHQLELADLTVAVVDGRVVLRSSRLGREVIPRLSTAHAYSDRGNLAIYRFLGALQGQDSDELAFSWGPLAVARFLPRVSAGRIVLSLARWRLERTTLGRLGEVTGVARARRVDALRDELGLPRWVAFADGDHVLPIDLDNPIAVDAAVHVIKDRDAAELVELFDPAPACARGPEGGFVHEIVVPFLSAQPPPHAVASRSRPSSAREVVRRFAPGTEWLYAKLYGGPAEADRVLREVVAPVVRGALDSGAATAWFFVRYGDPDWHLRVRLRGDPRRLLGEVLPAFTTAAATSLASGQLWRIQLDTYEREVERYGGADGIALAEQLFFADSDASLAIVEADGGDPPDERWRTAIVGVDRLLDDIGCDLAAKRAIVRASRRALAAELRADRKLERQLADKFRSERRALETEWARAADIFDARSRRVHPLGDALRAAAADGRLARPISELAASFIHMQINRVIVAGAARAQELVLCHFLDRLYDGRAARQ